MSASVDDGWGYVCDVDECRAPATHSVGSEREFRIELPKHACGDHVETVRSPGDWVIRLSDGRRVA